MPAKIDSHLTLNLGKKSHDQGFAKDTDEEIPHGSFRPFGGLF